MNKNEALEKSIDCMIDDLFAKSAPETIAIAEKKPAKSAPMEAKKPPMTADEGLAGLDSSEQEDDGDNGRPKDPSAMSKRNKDGASHLDYDSSITSAAKKVPNETTVAKSFSVSEEDFEILRKAKAAHKEEELRKVKTEQADLIKSAVRAELSPLKAENEALRKSLADQEALIKSIAKKPQVRKSVSSVAVLEKSFSNSEATEGGKAPRNEAFTKSEMLDVAETLMKSGALTLNDVIELEDTGYIYDGSKRKRLEDELRKR